MDITAVMYNRITSGITTWARFAYRRSIEIPLILNPRTGTWASGTGCNSETSGISASISWSQRKKYSCEKMKGLFDTMGMQYLF
jgi:hypothetical protein